MKFGELKSIGHNLADSLASGIGLLIGYCQTDIFGEAARSPSGFITADFLSGATSGGPASPDLAWAIREYAAALPDLCERHGCQPSEFRALSARFGIDAVYGDHFTVTVEDASGRVSVDRYIGRPGRRLPLRSHHR